MVDIEQIDPADPGIGVPDRPLGEAPQETPPEENPGHPGEGDRG